MSAVEAQLLRGALGSARDGDGHELLYELERGLSSWARIAARFAIGFGVVVVMFAGVAAFLAPAAAAILLGAGVLPAAVLATAAATLGYRFDIGLSVFADGRLRRVGWDGISERNVRDYRRVTLGPGSPASGGPFVEAG